MGGEEKARLATKYEPLQFEEGLAQLQRGLTLLDVADLTCNHETYEEVTAGAMKIYCSVVQLLPLTCSSPKEEMALHQRLELLRTRLAIAGYYTLFLPGSVARCLAAVRTWSTVPPAWITRIHRKFPSRLIANEDSASTAGSTS